MWLDKDFWDNRWQYNNAFAGRPDWTLEDLFQVTGMELSEPAFVYLSEPDYPPRSYRLSVTSTTTETFAWTAAVSPQGLAWLDVSPLSGDSGAELEITLTPAGLDPGAYQASLRVQAAAPAIENGDQTVAITLYVFEQVYSVHLPLAVRP
jgi:hypothetical protein